MSHTAYRISSNSLAVATLAFLLLSGCQHRAEKHHEAEHKVVVTSPVVKDVVITQQYVCQIHSCRHIDVCALEDGYLEAIPVKEGQSVHQGETMFTILPTLYQAKLQAEEAEVELAQIEFDNTQRLLQRNVVSKPEVALAKAKLEKAKAKLALAQAELNFTTIKAPFDGIIDRQHHQQGSLIAEGDMLTTLSDNSVMWVYFNMPEAGYLAYQANKEKGDLTVELVLANGTKFSHLGKIGAIEANFNNETGNIAFRADFPNPDGLLRHGQTGTVLLSRVVKDALVIPQRATFEILAKKYAYVVGDAASATNHEAEHDAHGVTHEATLRGQTPGNLHLNPVALRNESHDSHNADQAHTVEEPHTAPEEHSEQLGEHHGAAHQREIVIQNELDDIYIIADGLNVDDRIVLEGVRQVRDGDKLEYEFLDPQKALTNLKFHAE
ncbi:MAG: efflux RND transporter periplasmic adaptor subunit [Planctomycetales bacterium]|nr:efflux RND transporter periplasmic adaptor subunit [Planctomycetales bacterium]